MLLAAHLCHSGVLWAEEDLPLAAALQMKRGLALYREIWFDKPPLVSAVYLLWGAHTGWLLRVAGAVYGILASILAYVLATGLWSRREGYWAAAGIAFFLTFDTPSAVLPLAADLLILVPHLAAIWLVTSGRPLLGGIAAGVAFLFNAKGAVVLLACAVFAWPSVAPLAIGFALPNLAALGWLWATGSLMPYIDQVWLWMSQYAGDTFVADPVWNGVVRTANWLGFHAVLAVGAAIYFWRERNWRMALWLALSLAGVVLGFRFFPRYYFLLLPVTTLAAARGFAVVRPRWAVCVALATMAVPLVRFGPKYVTLAMGRETHWSDLAMDRDSRAASAKILLGSPPQSTLYVWGYRPEIFVYTGLRPATKYLECQALTGVPADRHLGQTHVVLTKGTPEARAEVIQARPDVVVDGLGPYNPALAITRYPDMAKLLEGYVEGGRTAGSVIYVKR